LQTSKNRITHFFYPIGSFTLVKSKKLTISENRAKQSIYNTIKITYHAK